MNNLINEGTDNSATVDKLWMVMESLRGWSQ